MYVNTNHPGAVQTELHRHGNLITRDAVSPFFITPELGALTQLYLATSPDVETKDIKGQYYVCHCGGGFQGQVTNVAFVVGAVC